MTSCTVVLALCKLKLLPVQHSMVLRSSSISPFTICNASSRFIRMGKLWHTALATPRLLRRRSAKYSVTPNALTPYIDAILHCHGANLVVINMWHGIYIYVQSKATIPASTMRRGFHQPPLPLLEEVDLLDPIMKGSCQLHALAKSSVQLRRIRS